tara:strand:- start:202 stop:903 length:702 start_codon:yes stop_codon:yes gene_type:complete
MSVEIMSRVWANSEAKGTARLVLLAIADHANPSGIAWPSLRRIAQYANVDRSNVSRAIKSLIQIGELERVGYTKSFSGATKYKVKVVRSRTSAEAQPSAEAHWGGDAEAHQGVVRKRTTNRHRTKYIEPSIDIGHFDEFWTQYPKKVAKGGARKAYEKALKLTTHEDIMAGLARYNPNPQYICNPATWLNQERWNDEPSSIKPDSFASDQSRSDGNRHAEAYERFVARRAADQ